MKSSLKRATAFSLLVASAAFVGPANGQEVRTATSVQQRFAVLSGVTDLKVISTSDGGAQVTANLDGRAFAVRFPRNWNGQAILFAHGYTPPAKGKVDEVSDDPVKKDPSLGLLPSAYAEGYAVGHTAYDKLGFAVDSGVSRNVSLERLLRKIGAKKVFLTGGSMGGGITALTSQRYPSDFDGAMAVCGVVSDWRGPFDYSTNVRALFNYFSEGTPYALPGTKDVTRNISGANPLLLFIKLRKLQDDATANPNGQAAQIMRLTFSAVPGVQAKPEFSSLLYTFLLNANGIDDIKQVLGGLPVDNVNITYRSPLLDEAGNVALNREIQRYKADSSARNKIVTSYNTTGRQVMKLLTIHNAYDPLVSYEQEEGLRTKVKNAGNTASLAQQTAPTMTERFDSPAVHGLIPGANLFKGSFGAMHCGFTAQQMTAGFHDLKTWVDTGRKPAESFRADLDH